MYKRRTFSFTVAVCLALQPGWAEHKRSWLDVLRELWARHPAWYAYDGISSQFVVSVPLDEGVKTSPVDGGPKRIWREPDIFLYGATSNETHTLRGELRVMKKDGKHDVLEAFKKLKIQEVGETETSEDIAWGNLSNGWYILAYEMQDGSMTAEKIMNLYNDYAVSYRITTKPGAKEEEQARKMVADFALLRKCSHENAGEDECLREGDEL